MGDFTTLSLDLGSTLGYAIGCSGVIIESGEVTLSPGVNKTHPGHRWMKFQQWLSKYQSVDEIVFEDVMFFGNNGVKAARVYCGLLAVLQMFALGHGKRMSSLTPSQVKKDFTGAGNSKKDVICEVAHTLGWQRGTKGTMNNHNEADAIALLWVVYVRRGIEPNFLENVCQLSLDK